MKIVENLLPKDHPNRSGKKLESLIAMVIHYTQNENPGATALMNDKYIGRKYVRNDAGEFESDGKTKFSYGSAHVFCDMNGVVTSIPTDEVSWGCGDKNFNGGQQKISAAIFGKRPNYHTVSVEICNNDVIKHSDADWEGAVANAKEWVIAFLKEKGLKVDVVGSLHPQEITVVPKEGDILILRHYDVSGKNCPAPFVKNIEAWSSFINDIAEAV